MNNWWKLMAWLMVLGLTAAGVYRPVLAREIVDTSKSDCTISLKIDSEGNASGGSFSAYRVAEVVNEDGNDVFKSLYGDTTVDISTATKKTELITLYSEYIPDGKVVEEPVTTTAAEGSIVFTNLKPGLYLVIQTEAVSGYSDFEKHLVSVPYWDDANNKYVYDVVSEDKGQIETSTESTTETTEEDETEVDEEDDVEDDDGDDSSSSDSESSSSKNLPQTGQLWWPLPVLLCAGVVLMLVGRKIRK